jgi:hypothetical protein
MWQGQAMKTPLLTLLAILVAGCHFDKLFNTSSEGQPSGVAVTATRLAFRTQPANGTAGAPLATVRVAAEDDAGGVALSFESPITVQLQANPGGATLSATVTAVNGIATFSTLEVDKAAQGYSLGATASGSGLAGATSTSFDIAAGPASALAFTVQPSNTSAGSKITPPVQVTALDTFGNVVVSFSGTISVALGHDGSLLGGTKLSGTTQVSAVSGVATFSDLSIGNPSVTYYTLTGAFGAAASVKESAQFAVGP